MEETHQYDTEQVEARFESRVQEWMREQNLWFQLTHARSGGELFRSLTALVVRFLIVAILLLAALWYLNRQRPAKADQVGQLNTAVEEFFNSPKAELRGANFKLKSMLEGQLNLSMLTIEAGETSIFQDWEAKGDDEPSTLQLEQVTLDTVSMGHGVWAQNKITEVDAGIGRLKLKLGALDEKSALESYDALFQECTVDTVTIDDTTIYWGEELHEKGAIEESKVTVTRSIEGWVFKAEGGRFSHGWLNNAAIKKMTVLLQPDRQVVIQECQLGVGQGTIDLEGTLTYSQTPTVDINFKAKAASLSGLLPKYYSKWIEGNVDFEGKATGHFNRKNDISYEMKLNLHYGKDNPQKEAVATDELSSFVMFVGDFPLWTTLNIRDGSRNFNRLRFMRGGANLTVTPGKLAVNQLEIRSSNIVTIKGQFDATSENFDLKRPRASIDHGSTIYKGAIHIGVLMDVFAKYPEIFEAFERDVSTSKVWFGKIDLDHQIDEISNGITQRIEAVIQDAKNK